MPHIRYRRPSCLFRSAAVQNVLLAGIWHGGLSDESVEDIANANLHVMRFLGLSLEDYDFAVNWIEPESECLWRSETEKIFREHFTARSRQSDNQFGQMI